MKEWEKRIKKDKGKVFLVISISGAFVCERIAIGYMVRFGTRLILDNQVKKVFAL